MGCSSSNNKAPLAASPVAAKAGAPVTAATPAAVDTTGYTDKEERPEETLPPVAPPAGETVDEDIDRSTGLPTKKALEELGPNDRAETILGCGAVKMLSADWLLQQPETWVAQRCQDLPKEAFIKQDIAMVMWKKPYALVVLSYGWITRSHPDPQGHHFSTLRKYIKKQKSFRKKQAAQKDEQHLSDVGVFWDYCSLPQPGPDGKRTELEQKIFSCGLMAINLLYGLLGSITIQLKTLPEQFIDDDGNPSNTTEYMDRGWCFFEMASASICKGSAQVFDLSAAQAVVDDPSTFVSHVREAAQGTRIPPLSPADMASELKKRKFTNGNDCDMVIKIYKRFFEEITPTQTVLAFANASTRGTWEGWGDEDIYQLARALPSYTSCRKIELEGHRAMGEPGLQTLFKVLKKMPQLTQLTLPHHLKDTATAKEMDAWWSNRPGLKEQAKKDGNLGLLFWGFMGQKD